MSFKVNWSSLETESLRDWTVDVLTSALNSGKRPNVLASDITIKDLNFGKIAPDFEILEVGELGKDRFRGIFKIKYNGDFHLTLHTKVQANPLKIHSENSKELEISDDHSFVTPHFLLSTEAFNIPLDLKLSDIKISGIGIIVYSQTKGLTLVFRNDPLDSIKVSSTFDTVQVLSNFLQSQIENQIRDLFRETLPTLIHKFSLKYTSTFQCNDLMSNTTGQLKPEPSAGNLDLLELEKISHDNLRRLASLYSSRETLNWHVPKLKKVVQRNYLEKLNKNISPSLAHSLYSTLKLKLTSGIIQAGNNIPVDLLIENDYKQIDGIIREISCIQSKSHKSGSNDSNRPRRRTFKMGKKVDKKKDSASQSMPSEKPLCSTPEAASGENDVLLNKSGEGVIYLPTKVAEAQEMTRSSSIHHPTPVKVQDSKRPPLCSFYADQANMEYGTPTPLGSSVSLVGSVGLRNTLFSMSPGHFSASPLDAEAMHSKLKEEHHEARQSTNRINIENINEKLQIKMHLKTLDSETKKKLLSGGQPLSESLFENPPPPYYHAPAAGY